MKAHRMTAVTACVNNYTNLISGITTTYGTWTGSGKEAADATYDEDGKVVTRAVTADPYIVKNEVRLNIYGNMSGIFDYDSTDPLKLKGQQKESFEKLWWKEAEPDNEEYFKAKQDRDGGWKNEVSRLWTLADGDRNKKLELIEFKRFYTELSEFENRWTQTDGLKDMTDETYTKYDSFLWGEQMMAWFEACVSLSGSTGPETCS